MDILTLIKQVRDMEPVRLGAPEAEVFYLASERPEERGQAGAVYVWAPGETLPGAETTAVIALGEVPESLPGANVFRTSLGRQEIREQVTRALAAQARLDAACARLVAAASAGKGIQSILDCAYSIIGNPMILVDTSYKLIACNQDIAGFREDIAEQQKQGFMLSENIEDMKKKRIYEEIRQARYPCYSVQSRGDTKFGWMNALVFTDGMEVAQLGIPEMNRKFAPSDFEIVHFLSKLIAIELQKNDFYRRNLGHMHSVLLCDLLDGLIADSRTAQLRAEQLGWDLGERMCLLTVFDMAYGMFDRKARFISEKMHELGPRGRWASYENKVVFLLPWEQAAEGGEVMEKLTAFLSHNGLACACSAEFSRLLGARTAYEQTLRAYEQGTRLHPEERVHRYEAYVCQHIGQMLMERGNLISFCHPGVLRLAEQDKDNDAKLTSTLRAYLKYPDNPGAAARELYIHKNTLFYRMHKIREDFGLNLSSGPERVWIQMTLEFLTL